MGSYTAALRFTLPLCALIIAAACGGTSVNHIDDDVVAGMAAVSGKGSTGGTAGTTGGAMNAGGSTDIGGSTSVGGSASGSSGTSGVGGCPPGAAAALVCPTAPPTDGDACDPCLVPADGCVWDARPVDGPVYTGECDGHWHINVPGTGCCTTDADCGALSRCLPGNRCSTPAYDGQCWGDVECGPGELCSGSIVCPCNADCMTIDTVGMCVPAGIGCCASDEDCSGGEECLKGQCKTKPSSPSCWANRDCTAGGLCVGGQVCACGAECFVSDSLGQCVHEL